MPKPVSGFIFELTKMTACGPLPTGVLIAARSGSGSRPDFPDANR